MNKWIHTKTFVCNSASLPILPIPQLGLGALPSPWDSESPNI